MKTGLVETLERLSDEADDLAREAKHLSAQLADLAVKAAAPRPPAAPLWRDVRIEMPFNVEPDDPWFVKNGIKDWWRRKPSDIDGITLHHVGSYSDAHWTAAYITRPRAQGGKGLPRMQYHFWVDPDGTLLYCLDVLYGPWHDHCGHWNTHVSIALNGAYHRESPTQATLSTAANLVAWLMMTYEVPQANVEGHNEWAQRCLRTKRQVTQCPGWDTAPWRAPFFELLKEALIVRDLRAGANVTFGSLDAIAPGQLAELESLGRGG